MVLGGHGVAWTWPNSCCSCSAEGKLYVGHLFVERNHLSMTNALFMLCLVMFCFPGLSSQRSSLDVNEGMPFYLIKIQDQKKDEDCTKNDRKNTS